VTEATVDMRALVEHVAKALVDAPEQVLVNQVQEEQITVLELEVAETDLGRVIGRQGRNARAMRTLLAAASAKLEASFELEILE
jgi:predicted RNA-binding protein YlqC (UPF0109 family)